MHTYKTMMKRRFLYGFAILALGVLIYFGAGEKFFANAQLPPPALDFTITNTTGDITINKAVNYGASVNFFIAPLEDNFDGDNITFSWSLPPGVSASMTLSNSYCHTSGKYLGGFGNPYSYCQPVLLVAIDSATPIGSYTIVFHATAGPTSGISHSVPFTLTVVNNPPVGTINGSCGASHYSCVAGLSANQANGAGSWTWGCTGLNGGSDATPSCSEVKVPGKPVLLSPAGSCPNVILSWSTVPGATAYEAKYCSGSGCDPKTGTNFCSPTAPTTSCVFPYTFYSSGSPIRFIVRSYSGGGGDGPYSNVVESTTYCSAAPVVSLSAVPNPVMNGNSTNLFWTSSGSNWCRAASLPSDTPWSTTDDITSSAAFFALKAPQTAPPGGFSTGPLTSSHRFDIQCVNQSTGATSPVKSVTVSVINAKPTIELKAFLAPSFTPIDSTTGSVPYGSTVRLQYDEIGTPSGPIIGCTASAVPANSQWTGSVPSPAPFSFKMKDIMNLTATTRFNIQCSNANGPGNIASINVPVQPLPAKPLVTLLANPSTVIYDTGATIQWSTTFDRYYDTRCIGSGGTWNMDVTWPAGSTIGFVGTPAYGGYLAPFPTGNLTADTLYTLTCSNIGGPETKTTTVTVQAPVIMVTPTCINGSCSCSGNTCTKTDGGCVNIDWASPSPSCNGSVNVCPTSSQEIPVTCGGPTCSGASCDNVSCSGSSCVKIIKTDAPPAVLFSTDKTSVRRGQGTTLRWEVLGPVNLCTASGTASNWNALNMTGGPSKAGGTFTTGSLTATQTYILQCTGGGGTSIPLRTLMITVTAGIPTVIECQPGNPNCRN